MDRLGALTRTDIEDFLINEAALLDDWRLPEWRELFAPDCRYLVPNMSSDPYASPESTLFLIADDDHHLTERVKRLGKKTAHAEYPHSVTQRLIGNVRILGTVDEALKVQCSFVTFRTSQGVTDTYFGRHEYLLVQPNGALLIKEKRTILKMGALRPHGKLSIIV
ncbi:MAG: aromatic-ring-hydroxylating dioxygenase subunit beta [Xanthobacteraceae bacterium]